MQSPPFQLQQEILWEDLGKGIERQIYGYNETIMMAKVKFTQGAIGEPHSHPHTQVSYVESGEFKITIDGRETLLQAGDGFYVHPNIVHGAICVKAGILIDVFSPMRQEFVGGQ